MGTIDDLPQIIFFYLGLEHLLLGYFFLQKRAPPFIFTTKRSGSCVISNGGLYGRAWWNSGFQMESKIYLVADDR